MKAWLTCIFLIGCVTAANAETSRQKLRYIKEITGVSCSAARLTVRSMPNGPIRATLPAPAYVTIIRGELDPGGNSWLLVSDDNTRRTAGWVNLVDLNCI